MFHDVIFPLKLWSESLNQTRFLRVAHADLSRFENSVMASIRMSRTTNEP